MDQARPQTQQQTPAHRDMVFCHECENEWYRDEHGLTCPDCSSDFTEIIEDQHDPREELQHDDMTQNPLHTHDPWAQQDAPDPDEDDISNMHWHTNDPQRTTFQFARTFPPDAQHHHHHHQYGAAQHQDPFAANPLMQTFTTMLNTIVGGVAQPPNNQNTQQNTNTQTVHGGGPGFSWTATTRVIPSTTITQGRGQTQTIQDLPTFLNQMFPTPGNPANPAANTPAAGPLGGLLASLFNPANMQSGDAVYSQEALDRIISQLMEQNTAGNAPGPASPDAIANLPTRRIETSDLDQEGKADCSICMESVQLNDEVTSLPCNHWFHGECIRLWLAEHDTCPHCRSGIMPRDGPPDAARPRTAEQAPRNETNWADESSWGGSASGSGTAQSQTQQQQQQQQQQQSRSQPRRTSSSTSGGGGLLGRMRSAFGGGGGGGASAGTGSEGGDEASSGGAGASGSRSAS